MKYLYAILFLVFIPLFPFFAYNTTDTKFSIDQTEANIQNSHIRFQLKHNPLNKLNDYHFSKTPLFLNQNFYLRFEKISMEKKPGSAMNSLEIAGFITSASSLTLMITGLCILFSAAYTNNFIAEAEADNYSKYVEGKTQFSGLFLAGSIISATGFVCLVVSIPLFSVSDKQKENRKTN